MATHNAPLTGGGERGAVGASDAKCVDDGDGSGKHSEEDAAAAGTRDAAVTDAAVVTAARSAGAWAFPAWLPAFFARHATPDPSDPDGVTSLVSAALLRCLLNVYLCAPRRLVDILEQPPRHRLPDTRVALNHKFDIAGHEGYITVGLFENGQPGELFIQMAKEGSTIGGLMDTVATLTSISLQYGVPLESLVKKFAYQRFEPSGFTKNPDIRNASSITDYVFRWLGCQFIKGYKEATSPNRNQPELPMKEIPEMERKAVNRPVSDLARTGEREIIDVITQTQNSEGTPVQIAGTSTHAERIQGALGTMFMDTTCSNCGSNKVIRAGACGCCTECGTSQGCS